MTKLYNIITTKQFLDKTLLDELFTAAFDLEGQDEQKHNSKCLEGKLMATVFYEPSTRTRLSFESAMHKLGGNVISTENASQFSSAIKGESIEDTIKIVSSYSDVIVLRHYEKGSAKIASEVSPVPIINAGDGTGEHPTQALLDVYTIQRELKRIDNLTVTLVGDLQNGRTVHSLLNLLCLYKVKINLTSPEQLKLPEKYKEELFKNKIEFKEINELNDVLQETDVLYATRIQKERFKDQNEYEKLKNSYIINIETLQKLKENAIILHPLPRVNEIAKEVDNDKRAAYFRQAKNGLYIRMALLEMIFKT